MWNRKTDEFCKKFQIELPIIQAPMAGGPTKTVELVSSVSRYGGLGSIGAGYLLPEQLEKIIIETKNCTDKPFAVNLFIEANKDQQTNQTLSSGAKKAIETIIKDANLDPINMEPVVNSYFSEQMDVIYQTQPPVLSYTFGLLTEAQQSKLRELSILSIGTATCVAEGIALLQSDCDAIVAQGIEAGGHRGSFLDDSNAPPLIGLMSLLPQLADALDIPIIAAGGIMDGRSIAASILLGASAVQLGSAFMGCQECATETAWLEQLQKSNDTSTCLTKAFSGKWARGIKNQFIEEMKPYVDDLPSYPKQHFITAPLRAQARKKQNANLMSLWAGQSAKMIRRTSVAELLDALTKETNSLLNK